MAVMVMGRILEIMAEILVGRLLKMNVVMVVELIFEMRAIIVVGRTLEMKEAMEVGQSFSAVVNNNNAVGEYVEREKTISKANPYYKKSEFLLEKDRLPSEINRKLKPNVEAKKDRDVSNHGLAFDDNYREQLYRSLLGKLLRQLITRVDDRVRISLSGGNLNFEKIKEIKRTLEGDLSQVRSYVKRIKDMEQDHQEYLGGDYVIENRSVVRVKYSQQRPFHSRPYQPPSLSAVVNNNNAVGEYVEKEKRLPKANPYYKNSEFLLEKDRLPSEINRKLKPNVAGKKDRGASNHSLAFDNNYRKQLYRSLLSKLLRLS
ncbi:hypothetical protein BC332_34058 [Capsicum chinense]|nr:hypothetical protein BC332_34058 [Capsicum chinense]